MFGYIALGIIAFFFILIPQATFIIFGGVLIALILLSMVSGIKKRAPGSKTTLMVLTIIAVIILFVGISWLVSSRIAQEMEVFARQFPVALDEVMTSLEKNTWYNRLLEEADQGNWVENFIAPKVLPKTAQLATVVINGLTAFGISLLLGIYFAIDSKRYESLLRRLVPVKDEDKYARLFFSLHDNLENWLLGKLLSMLAVGALSYIGLLLLGIQAAFPLAFIAGFLGFIPNVGPIMAAVPAMTIAFAQGWKMVIYVAILYVAVQAAEGWFITPIITKKKVKILPGTLITFQFIMAILYGFGGLFMATPILVALSTTIDKFWVEPQRSTGF